MKEYSKRQLEIINTAIELIGEGGIQELTIKNLSRKIGFVEAAVYRHFKSKSELLSNILTFLNDKVIEKYDEVYEKDITPFDKINETITAYFESFSSNTALVTVLLNDGIYKNDPLLQQKLFKLNNITKIHYERILNDAIIQNKIRTDIPISELALIIMGYMRITVTRWSLQNFEGKINDITSQIYIVLETIIKV